MKEEQKAEIRKKEPSKWARILKNLLFPNEKEQDRFKNTSKLDYEIPTLKEIRNVPPIPVDDPSQLIIQNSFDEHYAKPELQKELSPNLYSDGADQLEITNDPPISKSMSPERIDDSEVQKHPEKLAAELFIEDLEYFLDEIRHEIEYFQLENESGELDFRALIQINPTNPLAAPLIITRPCDRPNRPESDYWCGTGSSIFHTDIWKDWKKLAEDYPNSRRAALFRILNREDGEMSGYELCVHCYMKVTLKKNEPPKINFEYGWDYFQKRVRRKLRPDSSYVESLSDQEMQELLKHLFKYHIDGALIDDYENLVSIEGLILRDMLEPTIEKNAEKLRAILTPRAIREYIALANRFLTNPNPDKASPLYAKFLEYEEILAKLR